MRAKIYELVNGVANCNVCFNKYQSTIERTYLDKPQPRYIGTEYFSNYPRILIMMINPGEGNPATQEKEKQLLDNMNDLSRNPFSDIDRYFEFQRLSMERWGNGAFKRYFVDTFNFDIEKLAFANMAWCATKGNKYPRGMLETCFRIHTHKLLLTLDPHVILLSGQAVQNYRYLIKGFAPKARIIDIFHYANRLPTNIIKDQVARVHELIAYKL